MQSIDVVAGLITDTPTLTHDSKLLIGKRKVEKYKGGLREFPGGKLEGGETGQEALHREIHEEFGIEIDTPRHFLTHTYAYPDIFVTLHSFLAPHRDGQIATLVDHDQVARVTPDQLHDYSFVEADLQIIQHIESVLSR